MTTVDDLTDYDLKIQLISKVQGGEHRRSFRLRVPATGPDAARDAAYAVGDAINEATGYTYKLTKHGDSTATLAPASIEDPAHDRWAAEVCPGVRLAIDEGGCFVLRYPGGSTTITDLARAQYAMIAARENRDNMEVQESGR